MSLSDLDKREFCPLHGWVGRAAFQRDRHDLCEAPKDTFVDEEAADEGGTQEIVEEEDDEVDDSGDEGDEEDEDGEEVEARPRGRGRSRRTVPAKKTLAIRRITRLELEEGRAELRRLGADAPYWRPKTRGDCANVPRPCPYVACSHNLYLDVSETGSIILNFPHLEPGEMNPMQSCALDLAAREGMTLEEIAVVTNLTRERIRQVELKALIRRARPAALDLGLSREDAAAAGSRHHLGPGQELTETGVDGEVPSDVATLLVGDSSRKTR